MILILFSRFLGYVRERAIADVFGLNIETDIFRLAFNIPDLMYFLLIAGGLNAAFIPVFTGYLAKEEEDDGWRLAATFFSIIVGLLVMMVALGIIFAPRLSPLVAYGYRGSERELLVHLMRLMFPAVFFTAMAGVGMGVHRSYRNFAPPLWGPIVYNAMIIASTYLLGRTFGIVGMAYGTVAGAIANFALQVPFVFESPGEGQDRLLPPGPQTGLSFDGPGGDQPLHLPSQLHHRLQPRCRDLTEGSPTALKIAQTMVQLPLGVFGMGIGMVILPSLSGLMAKGDGCVPRTFSQGIRTVFFVTIPSAVGLAVLRVPLIRLLFETGEFGPNDTEMAAYALLFFTIGIWAQAGVQVLTQVYYAIQETGTLVRVSLTAIILNTALSLLFVRLTPLGHGGLALAYSLTVIVNMLNYLLTLRSKIGRIDGGRIARTIAFSTLAALIMGAAVHGTAVASATLFDLGSFGGRLLHALLAIGVGVAVYAGAAYALRMPEIGLIREVLRPRRQGQPRGRGDEGEGLGS